MVECHRRLRIAPRLSVLVGVLMLLEPRADAAPFLPGDVVVYRVGDGASPLVNTGAAVFVDEYTPDGTLVQSVALPSTTSGGNNPLVASGTATTEGQLTRSADGQFVLLTGYASTLPAAVSLSTTAAAAVPRTIGVVKFDGTIDTSTALIDFADANNPRTATSDDGTGLWVGGATGGVRYTTIGSTTSVLLNADNPNIRAVAIAGGALYVSTQRGTTLRIGAVGAGLPTTSGQSIPNLPGFPTTTSPNAFFFADLDGTPGVDTLYVADDAAGLTKFALVGGVWIARGAAGIGGDAYRGVTGIVSGSVVTLYATRKGGAGAGGGGELVRVVDASGYNGTLSATPVKLAAAAANTAFRGVAAAPAAARSGTATAQADVYSTATGAPLSVAAAAGVLANDTGTPVTLISHTEPAHGTLVLNADGSFVYTPDAGYSGPDGFQYTISDAVRRYRPTLPPLAVFDGVAISGGGYGSAMAPVPGSSNEFYGLADLGPQVGRPGGIKVLPLPTFAPSIAKFSVAGTQATLEQTITLQTGAGIAYSGRDNTQNPNGDVSKDLNGILLAADVNGYDSEGLVALADGTFWVSDEYGPFITHFDASGRQLGRLSPLDASLPAELARRDANRGLEGLTVMPDGSTLVAIMQSALRQPDLGGSDPKNNLLTRIVTYDLSGGALHEYLYLLDDKKKTSVSELAALPSGGFVADERDGAFPPAAYKKLWAIDLTGATDVGPASAVPGATYSGGSGGLLIGGQTLEALVNGQDAATAAATLAAHAIAPVAKQLYLDVGGVLDALDPLGGFFSHDKIEGVVVAGNSVFLGNDGDFGIDGVTNSAPPYRLHAKVSPVTGAQDDGEYLAIDRTHLPVITSSASVAITVGGPTPTPTPQSAVCPSTPDATCLAAATSVFAVAENANPAKRKLNWKWANGPAVSAADLADPTASADYELCVYGNGALLLTATAPHGASWRAIGKATPTGYTYTDRTAASDGIVKVQVKTGIAGKAKAQEKANGPGMPVVGLPLPIASFPVTVQLRNGTRCWSATYTNAALKNDAAKLRVKIP
jgi:hypothetical protein